MTLTITRAITVAALVAIVAASAACTDSGDSEKPRHAAPAATARTAALDSRSQYDLAAALSQVESSRDPDNVALGYQKLRASWTGKRYRWRVRVIEALCRSRDACNVLPFARAGRDRSVVHGWMPRLLLDDSAFAAIARRCSGVASCEIGIEATLSDLTVDMENPTSLQFRDVRVL
jgi:hypothetical protein